MSLEAQINQDLKSAMLAGQKLNVDTLRGLKSSLLYVKVAAGTRDQEMTDEQVEQVLAKESKKRQESAELYRQGGSTEKAETELTEKKIIDAYLPAQPSEDELKELVEAAIEETEAQSTKDMGKVIGSVRRKAGASADGAVIAKLVKERLS